MTRFVIEISGWAMHDESLWKKWHPAGRRCARAEQKWYDDYHEKLAAREQATAHLRTRSQWIAHLRDHTEDKFLFEMWATKNKQDFGRKYGISA